MSDNQGRPSQADCHALRSLTSSYTCSSLGFLARIGCPTLVVCSLALSWSNIWIPVIFGVDRVQALLNLRMQ